ncbi:MAG TPA: MoxR family ATPase, partial [Ktedonobacterales bacterium]|nr:MoxR family ATPase [Ktedonobacterales bacterium]
MTADSSAFASQNTDHPAGQYTHRVALDSIEAVQRAMGDQQYVADRGLATAVFLALKRNKPLLLEGEPGVGKTEVAQVLSAMLETRLIRLQCYEGIDLSTAVYEWNYARQLLA